MTCIAQSLLQHTCEIDTELVADENPEDMCHQQMNQVVLGSLL